MIQGASKKILFYFSKDSDRSPPFHKIWNKFFFLYLHLKCLGRFTFALQAKTKIDISLEMGCQRVFASTSFLFYLCRVTVNEPGKAVGQT